MSDHPELQQERQYVDDVRRRIEARRREIQEALNSGMSRADAQFLENEMRALERADPPCYGCLDHTTLGRIYVGPVLVMDENANPLVVSWNADVARPWFQLRAEDLPNIRYRRVFNYFRSTLTGIREQTVSTTSLISAGELVTDDDILASLARQHGTRFAANVATIRSEQYELITRESVDPLVIEGPPGTGKTFVGLHRIAAQIFERRKHYSFGRGDALIVGPNQGFVDYIKDVLPNIGYVATYRPLSRLIESTAAVGDEDLQAQTIKGDQRMALAIDRWLRAQISPSSAELSLRLRVDGRDLILDVEAAGRAALNAINAPSSLTYEERRLSFERRVLDDLVGQLETGPRSSREGWDPTELRKRIRNEPLYKAYFKRVFPSFRAQTALREFLSDESDLTAAIADLFEASDAVILLRAKTGNVNDERWTEADLPLIDEFDFQLGGKAPQFRSILVDEVQDLTPMQLRTLARRVRGPVTLLGDLAQACGPIPAKDWESVVRDLDPQNDQPRFNLGSLSRSYRVPQAVLRVSDQLLRGWAEPRADFGARSGVHRPLFVRTSEEEVVRRACDAAQRLFPETTALVCPISHLHAVESELRLRSLEFGSFDQHGNSRTLTVLRAVDAKGLEFKHTIVVEPEAILVERGTGKQALYVALTRCIDSLTVVHSGEIPNEFLPLPVPEVSIVDESNAALASDEEDLNGSMLSSSVVAMREFLRDALPHLAGEDIAAIYAVVCRLLDGAAE